MESSGELRIDPGRIDRAGAAGELEIVVLHIDPMMTSALLKRACELTAGLKARILLVAVLVVPFPASYASAAATHAHLVSRLIDISDGCPIPVTPHVVIARDLAEGVQFVLKPESTVLVGSHWRLWPTTEERLARNLANAGHKVALLHIG